MPLHQYKCRKCGMEFEALQSMNDEPLKAHSEHWTGMPSKYCDGKVEKQVSAASLKFVGSGFYVNDYGSKR